MNTATGFHDLTTEEISGILNTALDDGEWHTPSVSDISIKQQSTRVVYGYCNISQHNQYHDIEYWFNINASTVQIWREEYRRGKINLSLYRPIYNLKKLADRLSELEFKPTITTK